MPRNSNPSLENLNGSGHSVRSNNTYLSVGPSRATTSRVAVSQRRPLNRVHSYPAPVGREYHYADNSAVGHSIYYHSRQLTPSAAAYQASAPCNSYSSQSSGAGHAYLLPTADYSEEIYERELDLGDEYDEEATLASTSSTLRQYTSAGNQQYSSNPTYQYAPANNEYGYGDNGYHAQAGVGEDEEQYYGEQSARPQSPTTQRYLQEVSPHDRMRLGLRRYETHEEEERSYEPATRYGTSSSNSYSALLSSQRAASGH